MSIRKKGFTLIELLVVISIISLLSSIVLAALNDARKKGRDSARIQSMVQTRTALQLYFIDVGRYPRDIGTLVSAGSYISAVHPDIIYSGIRSNSGTPSICVNNTVNPCTFYHMGVKLENSNSILASDADLDRTSGAVDLVDGISAAASCGFDTGNTALDDPDDLCYDLTPGQ